MPCSSSSTTSRDSLAYLAHPQHAAIGMHFVQSAAAALAYDYEIEE